MNLLLTVASFVVAGLTIVGIIRVAIGPTVFDRILAASFAAVNSVIMLMLIGVRYGRPELFVDIGLAYALLAFLFPVALARYLDATSAADESGASGEESE
ncbi:monovalent cation/H+ antiporter complex subunit F [Rhabdothermincola salaria]|uniref:monovalent cation/H+ antiporter complex subunit F n=1 Tax=Rhabdothermincola salaria TaxID=2903142 RepID=UPI001E5C996A|nr:monovalent cation/H+ antiporter complex subunit F [Rhabdothermincola salaria]